MADTALALRDAPAASGLTLPAAYAPFLIDKQAAADTLGVSPDQVAVLCRRGELGAIIRRGRTARDGHCIRHAMWLPRACVGEYLQSRPVPRVNGIRPPAVPLILRPWTVYRPRYGSTLTLAEVWPPLAYLLEPSPVVGDIAAHLAGMLPTRIAQVEAALVAATNEGAWRDVAGLVRLLEQLRRSLFTGVPA